MSLVTLSFIQFNNYFNKILRKPENPFLRSSYSPYPVKSVINNAAFNENDGVTAYHVVPNDIDDVGDYLLVHISNNILSHWFVTEAKRNRLGQCMVTLQRDLLVDYYDTIKSAPAFIERGVLDNDDPMIFNDEGLSFNQIKTEVNPILDETRCSWIVGYLAKGADLTDQTRNLEAEVTINSATPDYTFASWSEAPQDLQDLITGAKTYKTNPTYKTYLKNFGFVRLEDPNYCYYVDSVNSIIRGGDITYNIPNPLSSDFRMRADGTVAIKRSTRHTLRNFNVRKTVINSASNAKDVFLAVCSTMGFSTKEIKEQINTAINVDDLTLKSVIDTYKDKIISVGGTLYKIENLDNNDSIDVNFTTYPAIKESLLEKIIDDTNDRTLIVWENSSGEVISDLSNGQFSISVECTSTTLKANQLGQVAKLTFPNNANRQQTIDAQYDIFAIPLPLKNFDYNGVKAFARYNTGIQNYQIDYEVSLAMAQKIATAFGGGSSSSKIYDLQILPYCPYDYNINITLKSMIVPSSSGIDCKYITVNNVVKSFILFCNKSEFERNVYSRDLDYTISSYDAYDIPVSNQAKFQKSLMKYRISSGNYASMFDFTPDMNGGVKNFKAYCTYKPYKPFIKVNPIFNYLYGQESFKDANGLILSGDYSITMMSEAWTNYLIQNKNFEAMFDRQIQTVERTNDITMMNSVFGAVSGTLGGTVTGAVAGGMKGGPYGAIAGAIVGGTASAIGGAIDVNNQAYLMQDSLDLQKQMHSYQIDNIKALPNTIQKLCALNVIDKVVPILEVFNCTGTEQESFNKYITFNGMSVGRIDTIQNFESNGGFIQGRFIRLEGLSEDYHLANAINTTFQAGFYFEEE